jgi:hypothetical protein
VVPDLRRVVEDADLVGLARAAGDDLLQRQVRELGAGNQLVKVVDIRLVMLAVVEPHGVGGDDRVERVVGVRQGGQDVDGAHGASFRFGLRDR